MIIINATVPHSINPHNFGHSVANFEVGESRLVWTVSSGYEETLAKTGAESFHDAEFIKHSWRGLRALSKLVILVGEYRGSFEARLYRAWKVKATEM